MIGVELSIEGAPIVKACLERKLLINCTHGTVIRLLPAMNLDRRTGPRRLRHPGRRARRQQAERLTGQRSGLARPANADLHHCRGAITMRHLLTLADLTPAEIERIFSITEDLKTQVRAGAARAAAARPRDGPAVREAVAADARQLRGGMAHLGGSSMFLGNDVGFGKRESVADFGRVLSEYVDVIVVRANRHQTVVELAEHCTCSVINGLTDFGHPCQALADLYTLRELVGKLRGPHAGLDRRRATTSPAAWPSAAASWA